MNSSTRRKTCGRNTSSSSTPKRSHGIWSTKPMHIACNSKTLMKKEDEALIQSTWERKPFSNWTSTWAMQTVHWGIGTYPGRKGSKYDINLFNFSPKTIAKIPSFNTIAWSYIKDVPTEETIHINASQTEPCMHRKFDLSQARIWPNSRIWQRWKWTNILVWRHHYRETQA